MNERPKRRWFQFNIRTAIIAILVLSSLLASYRLGLDHGRTLGPVIPASFSANIIHDREYDISDIAKSASDAKMLIDSLKATAAPKSWDFVGGIAEIKLSSDASVLTVSHVVRGHVSVIEYLTDVRECARDSADVGSDFADVLNDAESTYKARRKADDSN